MSRHDLVSAGTPNVYITRHAALNAIAYIVGVKQFVMSLPAISLGDWFSVSRKGGTGGGGLVYIYIYMYPKGENSMTVCGFGCKNPYTAKKGFILTIVFLTRIATVDIVLWDKYYT